MLELKFKHSLRNQHFSRHRCIPNFMANIIAGLIAYTYQDKKPSLNLTLEDLAALPEINLYDDANASVIV
ncbi:transposase [Calothrix sp. NIES-4071]|nr:transposase [Calothrix sp. NIES-4071]